ncbi:lysM and putative peptidoglycan-binding domain-containing protein 2-like [Daphnia carinata]|uniref:lysM and putative peptidoglycan-binding domain-containing protein 2-like n=1 Tax=Daphnia carinata TaxID=120202 RepID=UPI00257C12F5|nr:lysM and putative peptidoglycan-binding domain-containing protein 2-like [Daphnia carinata]XP_059351323.1 lysM and putative peptidoglycan-binding domain-containing protein 2-like [Daphnia carinata]XP_059351324.1 lysM and putative peptidoglycan-binding domain-containing protein 2-like [Daphnia carinata]
MDPFNFVSLSPSSVASSVALLDSSDEASDERTSFVRSAKSHRKYGSTTSGSSMNDSSSPSRFHPSCHMEHKVQAGDTLAGIALRYQTTMEYIKRINKMWTSDTLFLRETLLVPCPMEDISAGMNAFATLMIENETNGTVFPTLDASCTEIPPVFPEVSLSSINLQMKTDLARTSSASSSSSTSIDYDKSIHDYLGDIDSQIKEAKSKAQKLQKTSDVLKSHPDVNNSSWPRSQQASTRLRMSLAELGGEFNAATSSDHVPVTEVVGGARGRKTKSMFHHRDRSQDEIFEL